MEDFTENLSKYINLFLKYKYLILVILLLFASIGVVFYKYEVPVYTATAYLVLGRETVGKTLDVGNVQKAEEITTLATSHSFVSKVTRDLNLAEHPPEPGLINILRAKFSSSEPKSFDDEDATLYYMDGINVRSRRGGIFEISATSQQPELAANIANKVGELLIEENQREKNQRIQKSVGYIDSQLNSLRGLLDQNRRQKEQTEASLTYNEIVNLETQIETDQDTLSLFLREQEHLRTSLALSGDEEQKKEAQERMDYVQSRIEELIQTINASKLRLFETDKSDIYKAKDLEFSIGTDEGIYNQLLGEKQKIVLADLISSRDLRFLSRAYVPQDSDKMKGLFIILGFLAAGAGFSFGLIQVAEAVSKRFTSTEDIQDYLGLKVMGNLPVISKKEEIKLIDPKQRPKSFVTESYRTLATNLKFAVKGKNVKSVVFTSDKQGVGKSHTISNLGIIMTEAGSKLLLVDVDLRRPNLHKIFNINRKPGLTEVLQGKAKLSDTIVRIRRNLHFLPAGSLDSNPQKVLASDKMKKFIKACNKSYDFVFFDSVPLVPFSDTDILSSITDASVLVLGEQKSDKKTMDLAKAKLDGVGAKILGVAVNRSKRRYMKYRYYYYY